MWHVKSLHSAQMTVAFQTDLKHVVWPRKRSGSQIRRASVSQQSVSRSVSQQFLTAVPDKFFWRPLLTTLFDDCIWWPLLTSLKTNIIMTGVMAGVMTAVMTGIMTVVMTAVSTDISCVVFNRCLRHALLKAAFYCPFYGSICRVFLTTVFGGHEKILFDR